MIRVVLYDLGLTLVDGGHRPFPHVADSLATIESFSSGKGRLFTALVSDFEMPAPPPAPAKVRAIFDRYLALLDETGLRAFFEPVERRVTLSAHAGAMKPSRRIFETALRRLRVKAALRECLFITENLDHVNAARKLGLQALHFHHPAQGPRQFDDWRHAPALVARLVDGPSGRNLDIALRRHLDHAYGFEVGQVERSRPGVALTVRGTLWRPVGPSEAKEPTAVHVPFEAQGEIEIEPDGRIGNVRFDEPSSEELDAAASLVRSLSRHGQLAESRDALRSGAATHAIETDDQGRRRLVRKRLTRAF